MEILQNSQKFRVRYESVSELTEISGIVSRPYKTYRTYECPGKELSEVQGTGNTVVNTHPIGVALDLK